MGYNGSVGRKRSGNVSINVVSAKELKAMYGSIAEGHKKMKYDITYEGATEMLQEQMRHSKLTSGDSIAISFLSDTDESSLEEAERLNMMLALIKWCVDHDAMVEWLEDELDLYYEDYTEGRLDGILDEDEAEDIIRDLTACYKKVFG